MPDGDGPVNIKTKTFLSLESLSTFRQLYSWLSQISQSDHR